MPSHSATKLDAIFQRYEAIAAEHHEMMQLNGQLAIELREQMASAAAISSAEKDRNYFRKAYRATCKKMDLVRQLIELEEQLPTSAFL